MENLYDYQYLKDRYADFKHQFEKKNPNQNYDEAIYTITDTYLKSARCAYLRFGVYWWAVKRIMHKKGFAGYNEDVEGYIADTFVYRNEQNQVDELVTLIAGWEYKDQYNQQYLQGTRQFSLPNGDLYLLYDAEWELANL